MNQFLHFSFVLVASFFNEASGAFAAIGKAKLAHGSRFLQSDGLSGKAAGVAGHGSALLPSDAFETLDDDADDVADKINDMMEDVASEVLAKLDAIIPGNFDQNSVRAHSILASGKGALNRWGHVADTAANLATGDEESESVMFGRLLRSGRSADSDGDGLLDMEELMVFAQLVAKETRMVRIQVLLSSLDTDGSGDVSLEELPPPPAVMTLAPAPAGAEPAAIAEYEASVRSAAQSRQERFETADADGNGNLDLAQLDAFFHPEAAAPSVHFEASRLLEVVDWDGSGSVSRAEFLRYVAARIEADFSEDKAMGYFRLHDGDANGRLDIEELKLLVEGQLSLHEMVEDALDAGDENGDGRVDLSAELPDRMRELLATEYVQRYFIDADDEELLSFGERAFANEEATLLQVPAVPSVSAAQGVGGTRNLTSPFAEGIGVDVEDFVRPPPESIVAMRTEDL